MYVSMRVLFFFQAEDGIRDRNVTGVQTCALPIYLLAPPRVDRVHADAQRGADLGRAQLLELGQHEHGALVLVERSEERRVGKGGKLRDLGYEDKKVRDSVDQQDANTSL